jgi:hypothetical protein
MLERAVIGALGFRGKTAGGKLPASQVVSQAVATGVFLRTRFISAIAVPLILFLLAFHSSILLILDSWRPKVPGSAGAPEKNSYSR